MQTKIAIVTGGSSGIGRETAKALRGRGCTVYEFSRHDAGTEGVTHVQCDVSDEAQFAAAVRTVLDAEGRIDILVNNAGFGISGAAEFTDNAQAKKLLDISRYMREKLLAAGLKIILSDTPIIPIYTYEPIKTLRVQKELYERGVYVNATLPPACAPGECLLRCTLMATHTKALIDEATDIIIDVLQSYEE